jgi:hypothetical protein
MTVPTPSELRLLLRPRTGALRHERHRILVIVSCCVPGGGIQLIRLSGRLVWAHMPSTPVRELIPVLQMAIGPVILISGVGLLLLTLTNRYGRTIDRARHLMADLRECSAADRLRLQGQVEILYRRARLLRLSILLAGVSVLLASLLIIVLFLTALFKLEVGLLLSLLFIACMVSLSGALVAFIRDVNLSLVALKLELGHEKAESS